MKRRLAYHRPFVRSALLFDPGKQCHWCGSSNLDTTAGYGGERACRACGWGGNGEPDVPCMFYKMVQAR